MSPVPDAAGRLMRLLMSGAEVRAAQRSVRRAQYPVSLLVSLMLCVGVAASAPAPTGEVLALVEELDRIRLDNGVAAFGLVLVNGRGIEHLETRGLADRVAGQPIDNDAIFRIGSISKMFTGLAALRLAATSDFDLDTPISRWPTAAYYENPWQDTRPLSTAMLLEHTAGMTDMVKAEWDYSDPRQLPLDETLRLYPQARRLQWAPGLHASYSNAGVGLAGRVMELASGRSYEELMRALVFNPLKLNDTSVFPPAEKLPVGYDSDGETPIPYWHQIFRPFAAINSSLQDMGRFTVMLINRGSVEGRSLFAPGLIDRLETPRTSLAARSGLTYGYGLGNYTWLRSGVLFHGHGGDADGYLSRLGYTRANDRGYFLVITAFQGRTLRAMQRAVEAFLTEGVATVPAPRAVALTDGEISRRIGRYRQVTRRFPGGARGSMEIFREHGELFTRLAGRDPQRLIPLGELHYRRENENRATVFLGPGPDGQMVYQDDVRNYVRHDSTTAGM